MTANRLLRHYRKEHHMGLSGMLAPAIGGGTPKPCDQMAQTRPMVCWPKASAPAKT